MQDTVVKEVSLKRMEGFRVAYVEHRGPFNEIGLAFERLSQLLRDRRLRPSGPMIAIYHDDPTVSSAEPRSEAAVPVLGELRPDNELRSQDLPPGEVASTFFQGPPSRYPAAITALRTWIDVNGYATGGPLREIYSRDLSEMPPGIMYVEVQIPVRRKRRK